MSTNRFFTLLIIMALVVVVALTIRETVATSTAVPDMDSATRSYTAWAKAVEVERSKSASIPVTGSDSVIDSATRSYIAWARAIECGADPAYDNTIDSATRSYIAWAKFVQCGRTP